MRRDVAGTKTKAQTLRVLLRLLGPVLLVVVLLRLENASALIAVVRQAEPVSLFAALIGAAPALHLKVVRYQALLALRGYRYSLGRAYIAVLASLYVGMLTPGRVGDVLRLQYLRHDLSMRYAEGLAVTVMDRVCDLYVLVAFVALGATHFARLLSAELAYAMMGTVALAVLAPLALFVPGLAERLVGRVWARLSRHAAADGLAVFLAALRAQVSRRLAYAVLLTVAAFVCNYAQGWLIGRSLGLRFDFLDVCSLLAITSLLGLMPISVSGLGVRELLFALVFPALGMREEQGVAFGLVVFLLLYLVYVAAGFVAWLIRPPPVGAAPEEPVDR